MIVSRVKLKNWRNFQSVDVPLGSRVFLVGPNASGKSNFLDVFRFLRDIASPEGGGLQRAVADRGGLKKIRCLAARSKPDLEIEVHLGEDPEQDPLYRYAIGIRQESRGARRTLLRFEKVWKGDQLIHDRPTPQDRDDDFLLTETSLEQISRNAEFRDLARFLQSTLYLHLVPQLVRHPREFSGPGVEGDPFGRNFLKRISSADQRTRKSRLSKIERVLQKAVPNLTELAHVIDEKEGGVPHLEAKYEHWRPHGARQREVDFSDGTLRLIGLCWMLLEGESLLLMEEPELSLNAEIVRKLPALFHRVSKNGKKRRQYMVSTHSYDLLSDKGIGGEEVLLLIPGAEGTEVRVSSSLDDVRALMEGGLPVADAVLPKAVPRGFSDTQLTLF